MWKFVTSVNCFKPSSSLTIRACRLYICLSCSLTLEAVRFRNLVSSSTFWSCNIFWACNILMFFLIFLIWTALTILPMPANTSTNCFFLPGMVFFRAPVGSHLANLSRVACIDTISVFVNPEFLPPSTFRLTQSPCSCPNSAWACVSST